MDYHLKKKKKNQGRGRADREHTTILTVLETTTSKISQVRVVAPRTETDLSKLSFQAEVNLQCCGLQNLWL